MKFLAYFQSFTNTFSGGNPGDEDNVASLERLYRDALDDEDVIGLIIGSRPDCFSDEIVAMLSALNREYPVFVELGAETSYNG